MRRVALDGLPWVQPGEGVRYKSVTRGDRKVRLVEFEAGFAEADWCRKAHAGYVLAGRFEVAFAEGVEVFAPGDALLIESGEGDRHRARVVEGPVRLFLVEDA